MTTIDIITKKRDGAELTPDEIGRFIGGVTDGSIPDYQIAAWLMAVFLRGMTPVETLHLTLAMRDSGQKIDLSDLPNGPALDKHSTGGVGDKTTLVVAPILAALGVPMLKMSGRGLGFSGGTVDKLESIPGFRTDLSIAAAKAQVARIGAALIAQSVVLAPADKILYGLRDVTATVESLPLIASSIMSKKLAAGAGCIVLDVKVGGGAFMKTREQAEELARMLVSLGNSAGVPTSAILTAMSEPLGECVGNGLEVSEAIEALRPESRTLSPATRTFRDLCRDLSAHALTASGRAATPAEAQSRVQACLESGAAGRKFAEIVEAQGGPSGGLDAIEDSLPLRGRKIAVQSERSGVVAGIDAEAVGRLAMRMGAGREKKGDAIDPAVGMLLLQKTGDAVAPETRLAVLNIRNSDTERAEDFAKALQAAYRIEEGAETTRPDLILGVVGASDAPAIV